MDENGEWVWRIKKERKTKPGRRERKNNFCWLWNGSDEEEEKKNVVGGGVGMKKKERRSREKAKKIKKEADGT